MGLKSIWDGQDLPPVGCEVLAHLSSEKAWVRHVVTGYKVTEGSNAYNHRIQINLEKSDDPRSWKNARLLSDIRPLDDMDAVASAQQQRIDDLKDRLDMKTQILRKIEGLMDEDPKALPGALAEVLEEG